MLEPPGGSASICSRVAVGSGALALPCSPPEVLQAQEGCCPDYSQLHGRPYLKHWREWEGRERGHAGQRWREMGFGDAVREDTQGRDGRK